MNRALLSAIVMAGVTTLSHAQAWETMIIGAGSNGDLGQDGAGNICTVGSLVETEGSRKAYVLRLNQGTGNWEALDIYSEPGLNYAHNRAFALNPVTGALFAGGNLNNLRPDGTYDYDTLWFIREWDPATGVWETVDDGLLLQNDGLGEHSCADIMVTPDGDVYATGGGPWLVRKRFYDESQSRFVFRTADTLASGAGWDMAYHPDYGVLAVGQVNSTWTVRRSATGEPGSWETIDAFADANWGPGIAYCIYVARNGDIYVGGNANYLKDNNLHWVVRRGKKEGNTWTWSIVDDLPSGTAYGINEDDGGHILLCGQLVEQQTRRVWRGHWIVRQFQHVPHTTTTKIKGKTITTTTYTDEFVTIDDYQVDPSGDSWGGSITVDAQGNIYVSGSGLDANGVKQFIVRKLPRP